VRSPSNFSGYLNRPDDTAKTLRGEWVHTGDVGYLDPDGYLFAVDRAKDMVVTGGMNVSSAEVEAVLAEHHLIDIALGKPGAAQNPLREFLTQRLRERTLDDWLAWLAARGMPAMPVLDYSEALRHPHAEARGMLLTDADGHRHLNTPIRFAHEPGKPALRVAALGEHTQAVLQATKQHR